MSIKLTEKKPEPLPPPPTTYSLEGLSLADVSLLKTVIENMLRAAGSFGIPALTVEAREKLDRIRRVLGARAGL